MPLRSRRHRLDDAIEQLAGLAYYAKLVTLTICLMVLAAAVGGCPGASAAEPTPAGVVTMPNESGEIELYVPARILPSLTQPRERSALRPTPMPGPPQAMPVPIIDGPATAEPGDLVVLSAERSSGDAMAWVAVNIDPGRYLEIEQGRKLVFATARPGRYTFVLIAASLIDGDVTALTARHEVTIGSPGPGPTPPPPGPQPEPEPEPLPDGRFKLAAAAHSWAGQIPAAARSKASALAGAFDSVAAQIAAGVLTDFEQITPAMRSAKDAALGPDAAAWTPFFESLDSKLGQLWDAEQLTTVADMADAFRELATGLRAVQTGSTAR